MLYPLKRWGLISILLIFLALFFYFHLYRYLSYESLQAHRNGLTAWVRENFLIAIFGFMAVYIICVAISIPGSIFFRLTAGYLFGNVLGTIAVILSATTGAFILFLAIDLAFRGWLAEKTNKWLVKMTKGFQQNAFSYLLFLRLMPAFPFWVTNIVPALLGVPRATFFTATLIGIIPTSVIYVLIGSNLGYYLEAQKKPDFGIILKPGIFLPLFALALLSLLPVLFKRRSAKKDMK
ncbi:TVP38/TMEM64 family protein [Legionella jordanis]|uniref:TVP38/TMEM64 family protein n=1 Tax=Legionella jordanis TaxID=456 RepID=UPI001F452A05|nr:VTT domain-containing protein [Legionella jordanis]